MISPSMKKIIILFLGIIVALHFLWMSDDAFVTFRYVDNLYDGNGFVYNAEERVEGFTHPLWALMLVPLKLFLSLPSASLLLGIGSFLFLLNYMIDKNLGGVAVLLVSCFDFVIWSTSGLETMFFATLLFLAYMLYMDKEYHKMAWALLLATLTRPDGLIFLGVFTLFTLLTLKKDVCLKDKEKNVLKIFYPYLLLILYETFRVHYYDAFLPNTYYVKGQGWNIIQGLKYFYVHAQAYPLVIISFIGVMIYNLKKNKDNLKSYYPVGVITLLYFVYILKVGGDFMFFRFFVPVLPLWLYVLYDSSNNKKAITVLFSLLFLVSFYSHREVLLLDEKGNPKFVHNVVDERMAYQRILPNGDTFMENEIKLGKLAGKILDGFDVRILNRGQCAFTYYMNPSYSLESMGLCDKYVPHEADKLESKRPSHRHRASKEYILQRKCNFVFGRNTNYTGIYVVFFGSLAGEVLYWDNDLMNKLKEKYGDNMVIIDKRKQ